MNTAIRIDNLFDAREFNDNGSGKVYVGSTDGKTNHETVGEAIESLAFDHGLLKTTTRDVTDEVEPLIAARGEFRYAPRSEVKYIEVTRTSIVAVYRGDARPTR